MISIFIPILLISACNPITPLPDESFESPIIQVEQAAATPPINEPTSEATTQTATGWAVEIIAEGLYVPWSIVFTSPDRLLVSERSGAVREVVNGLLNPNPLYVFEETAAQEEAGLMGLAIHPNYAENKNIYACYSTTSGSEIIDRVVRLVDEENTLRFDKVIMDDIPAAQYHAGCRIKFGPDDMLYITTGDALDKNQAQDINSRAGKILRVDAEGNIPTDNPFPGLAVFSFGHRNSQGITWDFESGTMFASEHGPSGFDGAPGGDEINLIQAGGNYGWPLVSHDGVRQGTIPPLIQFTPAEAPGSALYYSSTVLPFFTNSLFFGALRGEGVIRLTFTEDGEGILTISSEEKIIDTVGRVRDMVTAPDGSIYFTTSNRDGRGRVQDGDDKIYRIYPVYE